MNNQESVVISKKVKRVSLQRYLWSRILYGDNVTFRILAALMINQLWMERKCSSDLEFKKKFARWTSLSADLIKELNLSRGLTNRSLRTLTNRIQTELEGFVFPKRNYPQMKSKLDSSVLLKANNSLGVLKKKLPPEKFIGKGYRDKGTAKNTAVDGSPSWQDVAQSNRNLDQELKEARKRVETESTGIKKVEAMQELRRLKRLRNGDSSL